MLARAAEIQHEQIIAGLSRKEELPSTPTLAYVDLSTTPSTSAGGGFTWNNSGDKSAANQWKDTDGAPRNGALPLWGANTQNRENAQIRNESEENRASGIAIPFHKNRRRPPAPGQLQHAHSGGKKCG
ncbi:hypothetical protein ACOTFF_13460 [Achromobacter xylosoxidans]